MPLTPDDIRGVCAVIAEEREAASPAGAPADNLAQAAEDPARAAAIAREFVEAGAAWWTERINSSRGSIEQMRDRIHHGPPRL